MNNDIPKLDRQRLRNFGLLTGAIVVALFGLILPFLLNLHWPIWPWGLAGLLMLWALIAPQSLTVVYYPWMRFGLVLGAINAVIILCAIYYLLITPIGIVMRLIGYDPLHRKTAIKMASYRVNKNPRDRTHMERPF